MTTPSSAILTRALQLHRAGQLSDAAVLYRQILETDPRHPNALHLLGIVVRDEGNPDQASELFSQAIAVDPMVAAFRLNRGLTLRALGQADEALEDFRQAAQLEPALAEAHHQQGNLLKQLGRFPESIAALRRAVQVAPTLAPAWLNLGVVCLETDDPVEAIRAFRQAIELEPLRPEAHNILGVAFLNAGQLTSARNAFDQALCLNPNYGPAHDNLGRLAKSAGLMDEAILHFRKALALQPSPNTHSNLLLALNYLPDLEPREAFAEHCRWSELYASQFTLGSVGRVNTDPIDRRLRIGYVSPDFCQHAVAYFIAPVLKAHDRSKVEIFCYANVVKPDRTTERLRRLSDQWRDISRMSDEVVAALVRADKIDILVDLAGHTAGNRLLLFARRPAPVQVTWLGYPNTTGLNAIDYRLTDAICDPAGKTDANYTEKLVRLPRSFSCYEPDATATAVSQLSAKAPGAVTFGCFNNFAKITPAVIKVWTRLLRELPLARLILKSRGLDDPSVATRIRAAFASENIAPERITLNGKELPVAQHLSLYHGVDIGLDPFPYNGTTTTCEALWMGVPVVTLEGQNHAARVGASLLTHVGLTEWISKSPDEYVSIAVGAAHNLPALETLRSELRDLVTKSPLGDSLTFTRALETAYSSMLSTTIS